MVLERWGGGCALARVATRRPAKRRESAKTARKRVAASETMPARAKASWCGMLRGAKARVVEKMMAAEARSKVRSME